MQKTIAILLTIIAVFIAVPILAQEAPDEVDLALQTLAAALNVEITPETLDDVSWNEVAFSSTALGCPRPGVTYDPLQAAGYQIFITYDGVTYDYRVTNDGSFVLLCTTSDTTLVNPTPVTVNPVTPVSPITDNECPNALLPRLVVGDVARTTPELGSNVRDLPDLEATDIGTIPPSSTFRVVDGPICGEDGNYWWQIDYEGLVGWTIQGLDGLYFVEPIPQPLVAVTALISSETATDIRLLSEIDGNILGIAAWSPDGQMLAIVDAATANPSIWLYNVGNLSEVPNLIELSFDVLAMTFSPDGSLLALGDPAGGVSLIDTTTFTVVHSFVGDDAPVLDIDFSPDGSYMVVVDDNYTARVYGIVTP